MSKVMNQAQSMASKTGNAIGKALSAGFKVAGTAAVAAAAYMGKIGTEYQSATGQIAAATGATGAELENLQGVMKNVYGNNYGENMTEVANAVATVNQQMKGLSGDELQGVTESAFALRDVFQYDVTESVRAANALVNNFTAVFADPLGLWAKWNPQRGDQVRLVDGDFDSGILYVDDPRKSGGFFRLEAVSVPPVIRKPSTKVWRDVRLSQLIGDAAVKAGLTAQTYGIQDYQYSVVSQHTETDMAFLSRICLREGYAVKVTNGNLVVFSEKEMENATPQATVDKLQTAPEHDFSAGVGLLSSSQVRYFNIQSGRLISQTVTDDSITGGESWKNEYCETDGEAQRWAYGYLRAANKNAKLGKIQLLQQSAYAAGSTVTLTGFDGENNGAWFVYGVDQDAVNARTTLLLRRPLAY